MALATVNAGSTVARAKTVILKLSRDESLEALAREICLRLPSEVGLGQTIRERILLAAQPNENAVCQGVVILVGGLFCQQSNNIRGRGKSGNDFQHITVFVRNDG